MGPRFQTPGHLPNEVDPIQRSRLSRFLLDYEIELLSAVYWRNLPPWRLAERRVNDSFFLIPIKGVLRLYCEGRQFRVPPGQFIMLRDGRPHAIELEAGYAELEQISIHCLMQNAWQAPLLAWFANPVGALRNPEDAFAMLRLLVHLAGQDPAAAQPVAQSILRQLMIEQILHRSDVTPDDSEADPRIVQALRTLRERYGEDLTVGHLANEADLSEVQFRKLFRRETGQAPQSYLHEYRLRQAARELRHSAAPISRIARNCGFRTPQYFHQCFRRRFRETPTHYRRTSKEKV